MALPKEYHSCDIESFEVADTNGRHGKIHLRPLPGQRFEVDLFVEGGRSLVRDYPVGTQFRVNVTLTDRLGGGQFLYTSWRWREVVLWRPDKAA